MKRFFKPKTISISLIILLSLLSLISYLNKDFEPKYQVTQNDQAIILTLENGQYFSIRPESDYIGITEVIRPFGGLNSRIFRAYGINYFFLKRSYSQEITSFDNERNLNITPINQNSLTLDYYIVTNFDATSRDDYTIQLDYSNEAKFSSGSDHVTIQDSNCKIDVKNNGVGEIKILDKYPSIVISQQYSSGLNFAVNITTECTE